MRGAFVDLCVADVAASSAFYRSLLGLGVIVDHGWYVELGAGDRVALALVRAGHETVPPAAGSRPSGVLVSFEVDDASAAAEVARRMGCTFPVELVEELGQRHFMVVDPDDAVVDVIERIPLTAADLRRLARYRREHLQRTAS
jgi:catechol 2,3-dioxygenase-like lactoylglutathione lyase family enzyme